VNWAYESQMDIIAERLRIDPVEIRMKNAVEEGDRSPTGQQVLHSVGLKECIQKVAQTIAWTIGPIRKFRGKGDGLRLQEYQDAFGLFSHREDQSGWERGRF